MLFSMWLNSPIVVPLSIYLHIPFTGRGWLNQGNYHAYKDDWCGDLNWVIRFGTFYDVTYVNTLSCGVRRQQGYRVSLYQRKRLSWKTLTYITTLRIRYLYNLLMFPLSQCIQCLIYLQFFSILVHSLGWRRIDNLKMGLLLNKLWLNVAINVSLSSGLFQRKGKHVYFIYNESQQECLNTSWAESDVTPGCIRERFLPAQYSRRYWFICTHTCSRT